MKNDSPKAEQQRKKKPYIGWLAGVVSLFRTPCPHEGIDPRSSGFTIGKHILGLYIIEILLKDALDDLGRSYDNNHHLHALFKRLTDEKCRAVEEEYRAALVHCNIPPKYLLAESVDGFLELFGKNPITEARYFWENKNVVFAPYDLSFVIYALGAALHDFHNENLLIDVTTDLD